MTSFSINVCQIMSFFLIKNIMTIRMNKMMIMRMIITKFIGHCGLILEPQLKLEIN